MKVAEKDEVVHGMLEDELQRCIDVLASLQKKAEQYPKGSLNVRKKRYRDREYRYYYLVSRHGNQVVNRHVPDGEVEELRKMLALRDKCNKEIRAYKKRIVYIEKLLKGQHAKNIEKSIPSGH